MKKAYKYGLEFELFVPPNAYRELREAVEKLGCNTTSDGSICPDDDNEGIEVRTPPAGLNKTLRIVSKLDKLFDKYGCGVNSSCGLHAHISNKRFFMVKNLKRIMDTWLAIEDIMYLTQPQNRLTGTYCKRKLKQYCSLQGLPEFKNHSRSGIIEAAAGIDRYYSLNLAALAKHGTIECRLHSGTLESRKVKHWLVLLTAFYNYCLENYDKKQVKAIFETITSEAKAKRVWGLLELPEATVKHFNNRIQKFMIPLLARAQKASIEITKIRPNTLKLKRDYENLDRSYRNALDREREYQRAFEGTI